MNIFIHAHYYLPKTLAGAEKFLHAIAKHLVSNGHKVTVSIDADEEYIYDNIPVVTNKTFVEYHYTWADAIITHLNHAGTAIELGRKFNKPVFHLLHNNDPYFELFNSPSNNFIIYNSEALKKELMLSLPSIVARPYLDYNFYSSDKDHYFNQYITLVNCCMGKGVDIMHRLADAMPGFRFMGVKGAYGNQIIENSHYRNIQYLPMQPDMRTVYDQTRIVIIPSTYESWGLVASEAMAAGIPVICTPTAGLKENCGDAAIYAERAVQPYKEAIENLLDKGYYDDLVRRGKKRNKTNDLNKILTFMEQNTIIPDSPVKEEPKRKIEPEKEMPWPGKEEDEDGEPATIEIEEDDDDDGEEIKEKKIIEKPATKKQIKKPGRKIKRQNGQFSS